MAVRSQRLGSRRTIDDFLKTPEGQSLVEVVQRTNPGWGRGEAYEYNCVKASLSLDDTLAGSPTVALGGMAAEMGSEPNAQFRYWEKHHAGWYDEMNGAVPPDRFVYALSHAPAADRPRPNPGVWSGARSLGQVVERLRSLGPGSRALVEASWTRTGAPTKLTPDDEGIHAFNAINVEGHVYLLDGQKGLVVPASQYLPERSWYDIGYLVTAKGGPTVLSTPEGRKMLHESFAGNGEPPERD